MSTIIIGTALVGLSALEALMFVISYHFASRGMWRHDQMGRHVMAFVGVLAAVFGLAAVWLISGAALKTGWFVTLCLTVLLGVPWVLGQRLWILWRLYRPRRSPVSSNSEGDSDE